MLWSLHRAFPPPRTVQLCVPVWISLLPSFSVVAPKHPFQSINTLFLCRTDGQTKGSAGCRAHQLALGSEVSFLGPSEGPAFSFAPSKHGVFWEPRSPPEAPVPAGSPSPWPALGEEQPPPGAAAARLTAHQIKTQTAFLGELNSLEDQGFCDGIWNYR